MLTKTGSALYDTAIGLGSVGMGVYKSNKLTDREAEVLKDYHHISGDSNLTLRNSLRGVTGGVIGAGTGGAIGVLAGAKYFKNPAILGRVGQLAGATLGAHLMTNKYSKDSAQDIIRHRKNMRYLDE